MSQRAATNKPKYPLIARALPVLLAACLTGRAFAAEPSPLKADAHTILLLHFDEQSGVIAKDSSGARLHFRFDRKPRTPKWSNKGLFGGAVELDGDNADHDGDGKGDADSLLAWADGKLVPAPHLTVEFWIKPTRPPDLPVQALLSRSGTVARHNFWITRSGLFFELNFDQKGRSVWRSATSAQGVIVPHVWQHVAGTYDGTHLRVYHNGREVGSKKVDLKPHMKGNRGLTTIGRDNDLRPHVGIRSFAGLIDEVRISKVARTKFDIPPSVIKTYQKARKSAPLPPPPTKRKARKKSGKQDYFEPTAIARSVVASGTVFEDKNANGKRDPGEPAIKGVWVTDGEEIRLSDAHGRYRFRLKINECRFVYLSQPEGYRPVSGWYRMIKPDEEKTDYEFNFPLAPDPASRDSNFAFAVFADSQFTSAQGGRNLKANMAEATRLSSKPRFLIVSGDLVMYGWLREFEWYTDAMTALTIPIWNVIGNHDALYGRYTPMKRRSVHHFNQFLGPEYFSWNYGGRHFVAYNAYPSFASEGARQRQPKWFEAEYNLLKPGAEVVLNAHDAAPVNKPFEKWRQKFKVRAMLYGHWHENHLFYYKGTPHLCLNPTRGFDWGSFTSAVRVCRFEDGKLYTEIRPTGQEKRLDIINPQLAVSAGKVPVRVTAFNTVSETAHAKADITKDGLRVWSGSLEKTGQFTFGGSWDATKAAAGAYAMAVTVKDVLGQTWSRTQRFEVLDQPQPKPKPGADWPSVFKSFKELRTTKAPVRPPLELMWSRNTGGRAQYATSPIVFKGKVYTGTENPNLSEVKHAVWCFDAATGKRVWRTEVDGSIRFAIAAGRGKVFGQTANGTAYALHADNGKIAWKQRIFPSRASHEPVYGPILLYDNLVITYGLYSQCAMFDADSGRKVQIYRNPRGGIYYSGPFPYEHKLYSAVRYTTEAWDMVTRKSLWRIGTRKLGTRGVAMCVVKDDVVYQNSRGSMAAIDRTNGNILWSASSGAGCFGVAIPTLSDGVVYTGGLRHSAFDAKTGKVKWSFTAGLTAEQKKQNKRQRLGGLSSPLVAGSVVYVGSDDEHLRAFDKNTGKLLWKFRFGMPVKSSPVVSGNMLFIGDCDGNLHAFVSAG